MIGVQRTLSSSSLYSKNLPDFKSMLSLSLTSLKYGRKERKERKKNLSICRRTFTRSTVELRKDVKALRDKKKKKENVHEIRLRRAENILHGSDKLCLFDDCNIFKT